MVSVNISEYRSLSNSKYQTQLLNLKIFIVFMLQKTPVFEPVELVWHAEIFTVNFSSGSVAKKL